MFFLLSSFRFCPPLKNDGRSELCFREVVNDFSPKKKSIQTASRPRLSGKVAAKPSEGARVSRNERIKISVSRHEEQFLQTSINTCPSFLNEVKNPGRGGKI